MIIASALTDNGFLSRWHISLISAFLSLAVVSGCASRPTAAVLQPVNLTEPTREQVTLLSATNRIRDGEGYGTDRGAVAFETYTVSIPPTHRLTQIEYPKAKPDPRRDMVVTARKALSQAQFLSMARERVDANGTVNIFVHGYNYRFQEALFRLVQFAADAKSRTGADPILFSWPSAGSLTGYVGDRDAALSSRQDLKSLIIALSAQPKVKRIVLFGHSMGGFLVMEVLQELKIQGRQDILKRLVVALAAPDIDAQVFRSQLEVVGTLPVPLTLFVSKDDKALIASSFISGERPRVGRLDVDDPRVQELAVQYGIRLIDISSLEGPDGLGHDRYASLAQFGPQLASLENRDGNAGARAGSFIFDVAGAAVSSPFRLVSSVLAPE